MGASSDAPTSAADDRRSPPRGLVAFDLDGTLLRGLTVCELLAGPLGRLPRMRELERASTEQELIAARVEMAEWYRGIPESELCLGLEAASWAPGAREGVRLLQSRGIDVVIASITCRFAVEWFGRGLSVTQTLGTGVSEGVVEHVWPRDKGPWLKGVAASRDVPCERIAAVGDSASDVHLLEAASLRFFVGERVPPGIERLRHVPEGDIEAIAREIVAAWAT